MLFITTWIFFLIILFKNMSKINAVKTGKGGFVKSINLLVAFAENRCAELLRKVENWLLEEEIDGQLETMHGFAIARCLGHALGLTTGDHWVDAQLDTSALVICEILKKTEEIRKETDPTKKTKLRDSLKAEVLETYFKAFEKTAKENGGGFSKKLSWVDLLFVGAVDVLECYLGMGLIDSKFPFLMKLIKSVYDIPQIKKYIDNEEEILMKKDYVMKFVK